MKAGFFSDLSFGNIILNICTIKLHELVWIDVDERYVALAGC